MRDWDWAALFEARFEDGLVAVAVGPIVLSMVVLLLVGLLVFKKPWKNFRRSWGVTTFSLGLLGINCQVARTKTSAQLAHEAYIELVSRKAAIPFDDDHDVIEEVYDSWYALFGEIRTLTRKFDAEAIANDEEARQLQDLLLDVLNRGLRPHLTRWQARFRRWFEHAADDRRGVAPQEIQREFPDYDQLVASLRQTNALLIELATGLDDLSHGPRRA